MNCSRCFLASALTLLTLFSLGCFIYLSRDTQCLIEPTHLFNPYFSPNIVALRIEGRIIIVLLVIFLLASFEIRCFLQKICQILIFIIIVCFIFNILICLRATHLFITSHGAEVKMVESIEKYGEDDAITNQIDFIQSAWECCGVHSFTDWKINTHLKSMGSPPDDYNGTIPASCLKNHIAKRGIYLKGCIEEIEMYRYALSCTVMIHSILLPLTVLLIIAVRKTQQCNNLMLKFMKKIKKIQKINRHLLSINKSHTVIEPTAMIETTV